MAKGDLKRILTNKKTYWLGAIVGTASYLLSLLISLLGIAPKTIKFGNYLQVTGALVDVNVRQQLTSGGMASTLGAKVMQLLTAVPKYSFVEHIMLVAGSILLVILGSWLYIYLPKWKNTQPWKLAGELLYGASAITLFTMLWNGLSSMARGTGFVFGFLGIPSLLITMAIYYLAVAIFVGGLTRIKMVGKLLQD